MGILFSNAGIIGTKLTFTDTNRYFLGYYTLSYVGGYTIGAGGTTSNITVPLTSLTGGSNSSPQANDIVIVGLEVGGTSDISYRIANYTQIADLYANDYYDSNLQVGYKIMPSTPDTSITITGGSSSTSNGYAIALHVWRNVDINNPLDVTSTVKTELNTNIPTPPAITPITQGSQIILIGGGVAYGVTGAKTYSASYLSNFLSSGGDATYEASIGLGNVLWSSGTYTPSIFTFSGTTSTNYSACSVSIALRPAPNYGNYKNSGIWNINSINY